MTKIVKTYLFKGIVLSAALKLVFQLPYQTITVWKLTYCKFASTRRPKITERGRRSPGGRLSDWFKRSTDRSFQTTSPDAET